MNITQSLKEGKSTLVSKISNMTLYVPHILVQTTPLQAYYYNIKNHGQFGGPFIVHNLEDPLSYTIWRTLYRTYRTLLTSRCLAIVVCGTGCTPCVNVMDIYHDELQTWTTLVAMTPLERAAWRREKLGRLEGRELPVKSALSTNEFTALTVKDIVQVTEDSLVYTISLPDGRCLGYQPGQHCILRGVIP